MIQNKGGVDWKGVNLNLVAGMPKATEPYLDKFTLQQANYAGASTVSARAPVLAPSYAPSSSSELETFYIFQLEGRKDREQSKDVGFPRIHDSAPTKRIYIQGVSSNERGPAVEEIHANNTMRTPWPSGSAMLYKDDEYISTITIPYTPNGTNASITIGPSADLKVSKKPGVYNKTENLTGITPGKARTTPSRRRPRSGPTA